MDTYIYPHIMRKNHGLASRVHKPVCIWDGLILQTLRGGGHARGESALYRPRHYLLQTTDLLCLGSLYLAQRTFEEFIRLFRRGSYNYNSNMANEPRNPSIHSAMPLAVIHGLRYTYPWLQPAAAGLVYRSTRMEAKARFTPSHRSEQV